MRYVTKNSNLQQWNRNHLSPSLPHSLPPRPSVTGALVANTKETFPCVEKRSFLPFFLLAEQGERTRWMPLSVGGPKWQMGRLYNPSHQPRERATPRLLANGLHLPATSRMQVVSPERRRSLPSDLCYGRMDGRTYKCGGFTELPSRVWFFFSLPSVTDMSQMHKWISVSGLMCLCQDLLCMQVSQQVGLDP